ncbi:unnamed protein product [Protopolystoma xenopodis]|uniref:Uncharacterized protein n=1 Tax=Protopolystoma xenopodis TaxID=117903 RepID=A0A3S5CNZ8_9PLAT|nr:unnamed protein product [Protopolystoma xenopodis]
MCLLNASCELASKDPSLAAYSSVLLTSRVQPAWVPLARPRTRLQQMLYSSIHYTSIMPQFTGWFHISLSEDYCSSVLGCGDLIETPFVAIETSVSSSSEFSLHKPSRKSCLSSIRADADKRHLLSIDSSPSNKSPACHVSDFMSSLDNDSSTEPSKDRRTWILTGWPTILYANQELESFASDKCIFGQEELAT